MSVISVLYLKFCISTCKLMEHTHVHNKTAHTYRIHTLWIRVVFLYCSIQRASLRTGNEKQKSQIWMGFGEMKGRARWQRQKHETIPLGAQLKSLGDWHRVELWFRLLQTKKKRIPKQKCFSVSYARSNVSSGGAILFGEYLERVKISKHQMGNKKNCKCEIISTCQTQLLWALWGSEGGMWNHSSTLWGCLTGLSHIWTGTVDALYLQLGTETECVRCTADVLVNYFWRILCLGRTRTDERGKEMREWGVAGNKVTVTQVTLQSTVHTVGTVTLLPPGTPLCVMFNQAESRTFHHFGPQTSMWCGK